MRILKVIGSILLIMVIIVGIFVSVITAYVSNSIDFSLDDELFEAAKSSTIATFCAYDSDGDIKEIYRLNGKTAKSWVDLNDISQNLVDAFI